VEFRFEKEYTAREEARQRARDRSLHGHDLGGAQKNMTAAPLQPVKIRPSEPPLLAGKHHFIASDVDTVYVESGITRV
jgi:hypothetical protein